MHDGVKALFKFTMAILYLAFQETAPSSCEVFNTIRRTAKELTDIELLLVIVAKIKLPKDSYFAIRRSFYMVQSSFNSDQFYIQSLTSDTNRQMVTSKPLTVQRPLGTKLPAISLIASAPVVTSKPASLSIETKHNFNTNNNSTLNAGADGARICTSSDRSKVCIQNIGKLGRSHIRVMDSNVKSNERSLMSPLRNCLVIGVANNGKDIILARQSSRRSFKMFNEQDLTFKVYELNVDLFEGFYLEEQSSILIISHAAEVFRIDLTKSFMDEYPVCHETLVLRERDLGGDCAHNMRLASLDTNSGLLWIYMDCDHDNQTCTPIRKQSSDLESSSSLMDETSDRSRKSEQILVSRPGAKSQRKIIVVDLTSFDIFSAFNIGECFGEIINIRTSYYACCQLTNPMSNQFSSRIIKISANGIYEHLLSSSDVVDFIVSTQEPPLKLDYKTAEHDIDPVILNQNKSTMRRFLRSFIPGPDSIDDSRSGSCASETDYSKSFTGTSSNLSRYYRAMMNASPARNDCLEELDAEKYNKILQEDRISLDTSSGSQSSRSTKVGRKISFDQSSSR